MSFLKKVQAHGSAWDLRFDFIKIVEDFVKSVIDEQKDHGEHGDAVYIREGEKAMDALQKLKNLATNA